ncbi:MAG TPA: ATPase, partial [Bacteroidia bacterium]|nr:ATPase [Bacteroidia bacterium]
WIVEAIQKSDYSMHLLTDIDIPWEDDPLREHPHFRKELFERYLQELNTFGLDYQIVNGIGESRLKNALNHLEKLEPDLK